MIENLFVYSPGKLVGVHCPIRHSIFRVVQEALMNVHRHANARHVSVELVLDSGLLTLTVNDDGKSEFRPQDGERTGGGIDGMKARMRQIGGTLAVIHKRRGTVVRAQVPLEPALSNGGYGRASAP